MKDDLGDRMKNHEDRYRFYLPRKTFIIIRIDGKNFHSLTRNLNRPFDERLISLMNEITLNLCSDLQGCKLGYTQSDEISLILHDLDNVKTDQWFSGNIQKIASISASMVTYQFMRLKYQVFDKNIFLGKTICFDSRVFILNDIEEVINYLLWRQLDATRNSIQMAARSEFSHKQCNSLSCDQLQEKLFQERGINWNDYPNGFKRGRCCYLVAKQMDNPYDSTKDKIERSYWEIDAPPIITKDRNWIFNKIKPIDWEER